MNFNQLECFCRAYDELSISKASEKAYMSRQSFGRSLRLLEAELGVQLFERSEAGLVPTAVAHRAHPLARQALRAAELLRQVCDEQVLSERKQVRIAFANSMLESLPEDFFGRLMSANPYVDVLTEKHFADTCFELLRKGQVDYAVCPGPVRDEAFDEVVLAQLDLALALPREFLEKQRRNVLAVLSELPLFVMSDSFPGTVELEGAMRREGLSLRIDRRHRNFAAIICEVRRGSGASIVAGSEAPLESRDIAVVPFPDPQVKMNISLVSLPEKTMFEEDGVLRFAREWSTASQG